MMKMHAFASAFTLLLIGSGIVLIGNRAPEANRLRIISDSPLAGKAAYALDLRWESPGILYMTSFEESVVKVRTEDLHVLKNVVRGIRGQCLECSMLGLSTDYLVTAHTVAGVAWKQLTESSGHLLPFDMVVDIDVHGDKLLLLGSRRENGVWAPDGAIAWTGTLSSGLKDLHPVHFSSVGPDKKILGRCGFISHGAVRFFPDGSYVVVPGVEPGVFLYQKDGKLAHVWQTEPLNVFDECELSQPQQLLYMKDPEARMQWLKQKRVVDDVLAMPEGPALVVREVIDGITHWSMVVLHRDRPASVLRLPFTAPTDVASLRADLMEKEVAFLMNLSARWRNDGAPTAGRLILAEWQ